MPDAAPDNCRTDNGSGCMDPVEEPRRQRTARLKLADPDTSTSSISASADLLFLIRETQVIKNFRDAVQNFLPAKDRTYVFDALLQLEDIYRPHESSRQTRKDGWPAISHPVIAATTAITNYRIADPEIIVGILFHDEVELNHLELEDLNVFGAGVESLVESLTNPKFDRRAAELKVQGDPRDLEEISRKLYYDHVWGSELAPGKIQDPRSFVAKINDLEELTSTIHRVENELFQRRCLQKWLPVVEEIINELRRDPPDCARLLSSEVRREAANRFQERVDIANLFLDGKIDCSTWRQLAQKQRPDD